MIPFRAQAARQPGSASIWFVFALCLTGMGAARSGRATTLADKLAGTNVPDFTVVYTCDRSNKLRHATRAEIANLANHWRQANNGRKARGVGGQIHTLSISEGQVQEIVAGIMPGLQWDAQVTHTTLTLSKRGNKLLVEEDIPQKDMKQIFVYDGKRSLFTVRGSNAMITPGFPFVDLKDFVFPGVGLCDIPLGRDLSPAPGTAGTYTGKVVRENGAAGADGQPDYLPGQIKTQMIDGMECVIEADSGWPFPPGYRNKSGKEITPAEQIALGARLGVPRQLVTYSDYRTIGPGLSLPARMHLAEFYKWPGLPYGEHYTADYTLQSASAATPPDTDFQFEKQLGRKTMVQNNPANKKNVTSVMFVPGKTVDEQFDAERERRQQAGLVAKGQSPPSSMSGVLGVLALLAALCGWYLYRRPASQGNKS